LALSDSCVAYYKHDTNGTITDATGNYGSMTINGATYTASGIINGAYDFDGTNDYTSDTSWYTGDIKTLSLWMNAGNVTSQGLLQFETSDRDGIWLGNFSGDISGETLSLLSSWDSGKKLSYITDTLSTSTWYHICLVWDSGNSRYDCWLNGSKKTMSAHPLGHAELLTSQTLFELGRANKSGTYYDGIIDEVGVWSRSLSDSEVGDLYNSGSGLQYPFGGSSGWTGTISGVSDPAKVNGVAVANISSVNGQ
jgi:hypothetical protein